MNVECAENDHIKFGAWIKSTAYNINGSIKAHINKSKNNTPRIAFASLIYRTWVILGNISSWVIFKEMYFTV